MLALAHQEVNRLTAGPRAWALWRFLIRLVIATRTQRHPQRPFDAGRGGRGRWERHGNQLGVRSPEGRERIWWADA
jgi:hypothetical protein